jgi:hypothetical protein
MMAVEIMQLVALVGIFFAVMRVGDKIAQANRNLAEIERNTYQKSLGL